MLHHKLFTCLFPRGPAARPAWPASRRFLLGRGVGHLFDREQMAHGIHHTPDGGAVLMHHGMGETLQPKGVDNPSLALVPPYIASLPRYLDL